MGIELAQIRYSHCSQQLGMTISIADHQSGVLEATFVAQECFNNRAGNIQGGIITAMLDDLMGYALGITLLPTQFAPTANLNVSFLRPAQAGILHGKGQVLKRDGEVFHLAAKLYNSAGKLLASATGKARLGNI